MVGRPQVDRPFQGLIEQWGPCFRSSVDGPFGAFVGRELDASADRADVFLGKELGVRQSYRNIAEVGISMTRLQRRRQSGVVAAFGAAFEPDRELRLEFQTLAAVDLESGRGMRHCSRGRRDA